MVEADVPAVGDDAVDELQLARFKHDRGVPLVERRHVFVRQLPDHLVEDVVLVDGDDPKTPAGAAEIFGVGVDPDGVPRDLAHERAEVVDEGPVDVVSQQHEIRSFRLHELCDLCDGPLIQRHAARVAGVDDEQALDLWVFELLDLLVRELEAVLLRGADLYDLEVVILEVGHLEVRRKDGRPERDGVAREQQPIGLE